MIDFDDVLNDPELGAQTLSLLRVSQTVNGKGRAVNVETPTTICGIVTQDKGAILERVEGSSYITGSILVTTAAPLRALGDGIEADIIVWRGKRYAVNTVSDYTAHGVNWAVCNPDGL